ncbi:MAG TPA: hypothetical protein VNO23_14765, partial [Candidatus Binatia bacterium]|nr:hypothetical protein [Candidatus Binatia bacterium]
MGDRDHQPAQAAPGRGTTLSAGGRRGLLGLGLALAALVAVWVVAGRAVLETAQRRYEAATVAAIAGGR